MAQIVLDEQISLQDVCEPLRRWITVQRLIDLRPNEVIKDDRVPTLLRQLQHPTLITIDDDFWHPRICDRRYCVLFFPLGVREQARIPGLLRRLLRLPEFRTRLCAWAKWHGSALPRLTIGRQEARRRSG